ncbi:hypothetical protein B0A49_08534 [Cryomyces minteri]|uniref:Tetratricopeptide repeat and J domain-containing co-chaperone DNJ1 n=2 Tax=Cryomyces minteri TaxID=331657 RepID=A0A4V5NBD9_9PEZI|nr:hypothetical protein B0A49_08534 [Cryomyces minteri]
MIIRYSCLALGAFALSGTPAAYALSASDIPADTPVSQLISSANANLAQGNAHDALTYFDIAVSRDPRNYLTLFKRGATYLSLGRNAQASQDFDRVLAIKPGFEGALTQRAKINSRKGNWAAAKNDYEAAGKKGGPEIAALEEAQGAATLAGDAEKAGDWEACVSQAGIAIMTAGTALDLRKRRARCRFEKGEVMEGVSDLAHVLQIAPESMETHLQISAMTFYSLGETEKGLSQIRVCLRSDPESKACSKLLKRERAVEKQLKNVRGFMEKHQYNSAVKLLVPSGEDTGLVKEVEDDVKLYKEQGIIHPKSPDGLHDSLIEMACEAYSEMNNHKKAQPYCTRTLATNPNSLPALISKATQQLESDDFEEAMRTLNHAKEHHGGAQKIQELLQKAQTLLKRSKQKDYYKVLGVPRDADDRSIKRAYRQLTKQYHPDKAAARGVTPEEAQKKMGQVNEAYEVLSDPELKARFDRGDDPNDQSQQGQPFQGSPFGHGAGGQQYFYQQRSGGGGGPQFKFQHSGGGGGGGRQFQFPGGFPFP